MKRQVFIVMPSGLNKEYVDGLEEAEYVYNDIIRKSITSALGDDVEIIREVDKRLTGAIDKSIIRNIEAADYCVVDLTGHNPNVFFELGVRYTLKRQNTILLQQNTEKIPFDVSRYRVVLYSSKYGGARKAVEDLTSALRSCMDGEERTDSLVYDALPDLRIERNPMGSGATHHGSGNVMPWQEFFGQCRLLENMLKEKVKENRYRPDVLMGITNGGLIFAEILGRGLFHKLPILSLWADRYSQNADYFDSIYNRHTIQALLESFDNKPFDLLLLDDNVATGSTFKAALSFLHRHLPNAKVAFLPVFTRNPKYLDAVGEENLIWKRPEFSDPPVDMNTLHRTDREMFPYQKDLREGVWKPRE